MIDERKSSSHIRNRARQTKRTRRLARLLPPMLGLAAAVLLIIYVASLLFSQYGSFTISVKDYGDRNYALALSETDAFLQTTSRLTAKEVKNINNITYTALPNDLNDVNGAHNGENYLAYTFYVKNTGERVCRYRYSLGITQATLGIDSAVRVRIYDTPDYYRAEEDTYTHSGSYVDYAKPKTGGNGLPEVDPGDRTMVNFVSDEIVAEVQSELFHPGDIAKITVVIWLEGEDPDCTDDVLGGHFRSDMQFEIVGVGE